LVVSALSGVTDRLVAIAQLAEDGASDKAAAEVQALAGAPPLGGGRVTSASRAIALADVRREIEELNGLVHALSCCAKCRRDRATPSTPSAKSSAAAIVRGRLPRSRHRPAPGSTRAPC